MLTVFDFVNSGGKLRTAAGWDFELSYIDKSIEYCICGYVISPNGNKSLHRWDKDGKPEKLPLTHGLNLVPIIPILSYYMIDISSMKNFDNIDDLVAYEVKRMSDVK